MISFIYLFILFIYYLFIYCRSMTKVVINVISAKGSTFRFVDKKGLFFFFAKTQALMKETNVIHRKCLLFEILNTFAITNVNTFRDVLYMYFQEWKIQRKLLYFPLITCCRLLLH